MAKNSMIAKQRTSKFKVQEYTSCEKCRRLHSVCRQLKLCRICFRQLFCKDIFRRVKKSKLVINLDSIF
ncbi:hypothetical protein [Bacillus sp. J33]|uniref:hypothetical protein n=1 Tax=Bacillus sp. J33 TaxID=935836 RepID=UPI00047A84A5|nr:hypothetical protein [Bacillus sp. J33]